MNVDQRPLLDRLNEAVASAIASVLAQDSSCKGTDCGTTTNDHSEACNAEHEAASATDERLYLILEAEGLELKPGALILSWWAADDCGFVCDFSKAARKTYGEAMKICMALRGNALPWLASEIEGGEHCFNSALLKDLPRSVGNQKRMMMINANAYVRSKAVEGMRASLPFVHPGVSQTLQKLVAERDAGWTSDAVNALTKLQTLINMHGCGKP